ncbi:MAG: hypothetical protein MZU84_01085 [Sphingobacterium sp.]|nr:hypothetical protein [Sphingobacterium sp.]
MRAGDFSSVKALILALWRNSSLAISVDVKNRWLNPIHFTAGHQVFILRPLVSDREINLVLGDICGKPWAQLNWSVPFSV